MKTAAEFALEVTNTYLRESDRQELIEAFRLEAYRAGAEAQREADAVARAKCVEGLPSRGICSELIRKQHARDGAAMTAEELRALESECLGSHGDPLVALCAACVIKAVAASRSAALEETEQEDHEARPRGRSGSQEAQRSNW